MQLSQQKMGHAALLIIVGTVVSRMLGFVRETVIAYQFGATAQTDAYLVALIIPQLIAGTIIGAITVSFLPVFTEYRLEHGEEEAWKIGNTVINLSTIFLLVGSAIYFMAAPTLVPFIAPGLAPETMELAINLSRQLAPVTFLLGLIGVSSILLQSYKHFIFPAFAGLLFNFGAIGGALLLGNIMGISGLVVGVIIGSSLHLLVIIIPLASKRSFYRPTVRGLSHPGLKKIGTLLLPILAGNAAGQVNLLVDRILASGLAEGSISALNFGQRVMNLPITIFVESITTAVYPYLSEQAAAKRLQDLRITFSEAMRVLMFIVFPLAVGMIILAQPIVRLLFERGAFDAIDSEMTTVALIYYSLGIFAFAANALLVRVCFSLQDTRTPAKLGIMAVAVNITLNLILVRYLAHGGLALATSITATVNCILLVRHLRHRLGHIDGARIMKSFAKFTVASLSMGLSVAAAYKYTSSVLSLERLSHQLLQVGGLIALGGLVYFLVAALLKTEELTMLIKRFGLHRLKQRFL